MDSSLHTILIIEDQEAIRESIVVLLELHNYNVLTAENGIEGLEVLHHHKPSLIISDINMPKMDGFEFLTEIRKNPDTMLIPVIMLTAKVDLESKLKGLKLGADDFVTKPFEFRELYFRIRNTINTRGLLSAKEGHEEEYLSQNDKFLKKLSLIMDEYIEENDLGVDFLSQQLFVSSSTFRRKVKKLTGSSPNSFVKEYKLTRAKKMIQANYGTLSEIAFKNGFNSLSYFSVSYKSFFGNNPNEDYPKE